MAREAAAKVRREEKAERAKKVAERQVQQQHQKQERDAAKALQLSQRGKRKTSQAGLSKKRQKRVDNRGVDDAAACQASPAPPPITTRRGRNVTLPSKYK